MGEVKTWLWDAKPRNQFRSWRGRKLGCGLVVLRFDSSSSVVTVEEIVRPTNAGVAFLEVATRLINVIVMKLFSAWGLFLETNREPYKAASTSIARSMENSTRAKDKEDEEEETQTPSAPSRNAIRATRSAMVARGAAARSAIVKALRAGRSATLAGRSATARSVRAPRYATAPTAGAVRDPRYVPDYATAPTPRSAPWGRVPEYTAAPAPKPAKAPSLAPAAGKPQRYFSGSVKAFLAKIQQATNHSSLYETKDIQGGVQIRFKGLGNMNFFDVSKQVVIQGKDPQALQDIVEAFTHVV